MTVPPSVAVSPTAEVVGGDGAPDAAALEDGVEVVLDDVDNVVDVLMERSILDIEGDAVDQRDALCDAVKTMVACGNMQTLTLRVCGVWW